MVAFLVAPERKEVMNNTNFNGSEETGDNPAKTSILKKWWFWTIIGAIIVIGLIITAVLAFNASQKVTIDGIEYEGMSLEEAEAQHKKDLAEKAKYIAEQKEKCKAKGYDYTYIANSDECITYGEYQERERLQNKEEYESKQAEYKSNPSKEALDAYNDYSTISTTCKIEIMESHGYSHMYELADGEEQSTITESNILSINGDTVRLRISVEFIPGTLTKSNSSLHQERTSFNNQECTVNMQTDHRSKVEAYINQ